MSALSNTQKIREDRIMLDKSLPYKDIVMKVPMETAVRQDIPKLPEGYQYRMYQSGDEYGWAQLETSVEEFDSFEDALAYFHRVFLPFRNILPERMCFITNPKDEIAATCTAWYKEDSERRYPLIHWVSTFPKEQGKGLGSAVVKYALSKFAIVEPQESEIFLHTQTWSYRAIGMYYRYGFRITQTALPNCRTDLACLDVLSSVLPENIINNLME